ncbi:MAG: hypothetical protein ACODAB_03865 [Gemmatimonadota bacterium]
MNRREYTHRLLLAGLVAVVTAPLVRGLPALAHLGMVLFAGILLFVAIFLSFDPSSYRNAVLDLAPEGERRERMRELLDELGRTLRLWMKARLISMAVV